jgi:hypothetical protein
MDPPHAGDAVAVRDRSVVPWVAAGLVVAVAATAGAWWVLGGRTGDAGSVAAVPPSTGTVTDPNAPADDATDEATPTEEAPPIAPIADDSTSDSEFAARVRPARPHRPPTPLHPLPEGADESFRVPEWMSELGPITRNARGDELRAVARRNLRSRRYDRALTWFRRSWWFEESAATASGIAETFLALGSSADALAWAQRAVELDADDVGSLVVLGDALRAEGRLGEARVAYEQVLEIRPGHREARRSLRRLRRLQRLHRRRGRAG